MNLDIWWTFFVGTLLICSSPGPNMLCVLNASIKYGIKNSFYAMAGCLLAITIMVITSFLGVGALLIAEPKAFEILRYIGASYLIYIGVKSILSKPVINNNVLEKEFSFNKKEIFKNSFYIGISNPKAFLFAIAFFPQFVDVNKSAFLQFSILFITFLVNECACYLAYAFGGKGLSKFLSQEKYAKFFDIFIGLIFVGFGIMSFLYKS